MSAAISQLSYIHSVYGGDEVTDRDGLNHRSTAGPISMVGSQAHKQQAAGQQQQAETAWSLLGKMYSSQVLAYMVAITDAQALVRRMRSMRPGKHSHASGCVCTHLLQSQHACYSLTFKPYLKNSGNLLRRAL